MTPEHLLQLLCLLADLRGQVAAQQQVIAQQQQLIEETARRLSELEAAAGEVETPLPAA